MSTYKKDIAALTVSFATISLSRGNPIMETTDKVFFNLRLFDGIAETLQDGKIILTKGDKIQAVEDLSELDNFKNIERVDLKGAVLLPGFIDMHVHISSPTMTHINPFEDMDTITKQRDRHFQSAIKYGLTTVRDMGGFDQYLQTAKKRVESGEMVGPRLYTPLVFITSMDGPPERAPAIPQEIADILGGHFVARVKTAAEARRAAIRNLENGADFLKTQYAEDSCFCREAKKLDVMPDECYEAIRQVAKENNVKVGLHATENNGFRKGIKHDVHCIDHSSLEEMDDRDIEMMAQKEIANIPTLRVVHNVYEIDDMLDWVNSDGREDYMPLVLQQIITALEAHKKTPYPPADNPTDRALYVDVDMCKRTYDTTVRNVQRLKKAGVRIGVGSDGFSSYINMGGFYWKELELMNQAGFSNAEVLKAATSINAEILGADNILGSIRPGRFADFVVIDGNPLEDITVTKNIQRTIKGGVEYVKGKPV